METLKWTEFVKRRTEVKLRKCTTDKNQHKTSGLVFSHEVMTKRDFSFSLWTKFGLCRKGLKLAEYATDNEVIMKQVI